MKSYHKLFILVAAVCLLSCSDDDKPQEPPVNIPDAVSQARSAKRGVSFDFESVRDIDLLAPGISWSYNWGVAPAPLCDEPFRKYGLDFCPMAWNSIDVDELRAYKVRNPQCKYLLAFNEPNLTDQANITPQEAAALWPEVKAIAAELGLKVISPAMNYGTLPGYGDPITWLDEFFELVPASEFDGIAIHCYMSTPAATKSYIERFKPYGKPIWMTEICASEGEVTPKSQMKYMCDIVNYMESDPDVVRYAWFIPRGDEEVDDYPYMYLLDKAQPSALTPLGKVYVNMSSQDKNIYYVQSQVIEAEHYTGNSISQSVGTDKWVNGPSLQPTTDPDGGTLELVHYYNELWVGYQLEMYQTKDHELQLRYAAMLDSKVAVEVDGKQVATITLPATGSNEDVWKTLSGSIPVSAGKHTLRIKCIEGRICLNWFKVGNK